MLFYFVGPYGALHIHVGVNSLGTLLRKMHVINFCFNCMRHIQVLVHLVIISGDYHRTGLTPHQ